MPADLRLFGIRHHGPGSAASLVHALNEFRPDILLLECPADAEAALTAATRPGLVPPVALLLYNPKQHQQASFLPFATFSPEWQAIQWCHQHGAHLRCFDLPATLRFGSGLTPNPLSTGEGVRGEAPSTTLSPTSPSWMATLMGSGGGSCAWSIRPATLAPSRWCWT